MHSKVPELRPGVLKRMIKNAINDHLLCRHSLKNTAKSDFGRETSIKFYSKDCLLVLLSGCIQVQYTVEYRWKTVETRWDSLNCKGDHDRLLEVNAQ